MKIRVRINTWVNRRRARKAAAIIRRMDVTMMKIGMSRQARRAYWREFAHSTAAREALLERMER